MPARTLLESYSIRSLTPSDVECHEAEMLAIAADVPGEHWTRANFQVDLPEKWHLSFVVFVASRPVAYAITSRKESNRAHLHHFMVGASYRGKELGRAMIEEVERRARQIGCTRLTLKVGTDNLGAQRFYARYGYARYGRDGTHLELDKEL